MLLSQCILTVNVSLMLVQTLPQSLSMMMMICLSMVVGNVFAPLHLSGTLTKNLKLATDVENLATGLRTAMLSFD